MSEAVKYVMRFLKEFDKDLLENERFRHNLFIHFYLSPITQGDYRIFDVERSGFPTIAYHGFIWETDKEDEEDEKTKLENLLKKTDRKEYINSRIGLLRRAMGEDCYTIEVDDPAGEELERIHKEFGEDSNKPMGKETYEKIWVLNNTLPAFKIYLKEKLLGRLSSNLFTLYSSNPEALYVMESIGRHVFECKDGNLQVDVNQLLKFKNQMEEDKDQFLYEADDEAC